uniref:Matrix AAA peptidase interacting protein 1 n=4 Tax=Passeriformes TaxID=9126 RepID=A0A8C9MH46_SERCA
MNSYRDHLSELASSSDRTCLWKLLAPKLPFPSMDQGTFPGTHKPKPWDWPAPAVPAEEGPPDTSCHALCRRGAPAAAAGAARSAPYPRVDVPQEALPRHPVQPLQGHRPLLPLLPSRFASSAGSGTEGPQRRVVVVRITSPIAWLRTRFYYLLIRLYFDHEFSIEEFTRGAKQAFSVVSKLLSQRKLDLLEELVSAEVLQVLKEKISLLPDSHRDALAADIDAIMYTTEGDVRIYYDDDGRKFVSILMCFWYLNGANLPDEVPGEAKVFQIVFGDENTKEKKHLLTANYEFQREFTEGAKPDWTITRIEHPRLLE